MRRPTTALTFAALSLVLCSSALAQTAPAAQTPPVDRSAEPYLRSVFEDMGKLRDLYVFIGRYSLADPAHERPADEYQELWYVKPGVFRFYNNGNMGSAMLMVSDGTTLMADSLGQSGPVTLTKTPASFREAPRQMQPRGSGSFYFVLLDGMPAFEAVVQKDQPVVMKPDSEGMKVVEFTAQGVGRIQLFVTEQAGRKVVRQIEMFAAQAPGGGGGRGGGGGGGFGGGGFNNVVRDEIRIFDEKVKFPKDWFNTTPPPGVRVQDQRAGGGG